VYAGSHSSYKVFAPLMDKIIEEYHGHGPSAKHESKMTTDGMDCPILPLAGQMMIRSTRIRVARNVAKYNLGPGLSNEDRATLEGSIEKALLSFTDELDGTYYSLDKMDEKTQKQLIEDHFLFKEGDRFLEACNLNRNWPKNRGIYHNKDKTFLVWVNEEDHLRIISMQNGASLFQVFKRLIAGAGHLEKQLPFQHDDHLGYITSCPTNCGTGLRASVHIHLPHLGKDKASFEAIAAKFHVQIRGAHGEHTETDDHIYDISNKRRLGFSEASLVQDMYNGLCAMVTEELKLSGKTIAEPAAVF
jgi:arginine kinase